MRHKITYADNCDRTELEIATATKHNDDAFVAAMKAAIEEKKESAPVGVFKDESPLVARPLYGEAVSSGCGSSAALCSDLGDARQWWGR